MNTDDQLAAQMSQVSIQPQVRQCRLCKHPIGAWCPGVWQAPDGEWMHTDNWCVYPPLDKWSSPNAREAEAKRRVIVASYTRLLRDAGYDGEDYAIATQIQRRMADNPIGSAGDMDCVDWCMAEQEKLLQRRGLQAFPVPPS
jgi:hypothetical protein